MAMTLTEFLANYLDGYDGGCVYGVTGDVDDLTDGVQAGIQAFAKEQGVFVDIIDVKDLSTKQRFTGGG